MSPLRQHRHAASLHTLPSWQTDLTATSHFRYRAGMQLKALGGIKAILTLMCFRLRGALVCEVAADKQLEVRPASHSQRRSRVG